MWSVGHHDHRLGEPLDQPVGQRPGRERPVGVLGDARRERLLHLPRTGDVGGHRQPAPSCGRHQRGQRRLGQGGTDAVVERDLDDGGTGVGEARHRRGGVVRAGHLPGRARWRPGGTRRVAARGGDDLPGMQQPGRRRPRDRRRPPERGEPRGRPAEVPHGGDAPAEHRGRVVQIEMDVGVDHAREHGQALGRDRADPLVRRHLAAWTERMHPPVPDDHRMVGERWPSRPVEHGRAHERKGGGGGGHGAERSNRRPLAGGGGGHGAERGNHRPMAGGGGGHGAERGDRRPGRVGRGGGAAGTIRAGGCSARQAHASPGGRLEGGCGSRGRRPRTRSDRAGRPAGRRRAAAARPAGHAVRLWHHPVRLRPPRTRLHLRDVRHAGPLPARAPAPGRVLPERHRRRRRRAAAGGRGRRGLPGARAARDRGVSRGHGRAERGPAELVPPRDRGDPVHGGAGRAAGRPRPRLRGRRHRVLRRRHLPALRGAVRTGRRRAGAPAGRRAGRRPGRPAQAPPPRLRRLAAPACPRSRRGRAPGCGPAGLAPRVLGDEPPLPRYPDRPPRRRRRPALPPPRVGTGTVGVGLPGPVRAPLAPHRHGQARGREDVEVTRQPGLPARPVPRP